MDSETSKVKGIKYNFEPRALSLIVTNECTAACTNCCFNCSPKKGTTMSIDDIKYYIKIGVESFKDIQLIVLTGGEPFLLGIISLIEIVTYIKNLNLRSRIVTNAFWASPKRAKNYVSALVAAGLNEINFSTGDEHQKFVKVENIINACIESVKSNLDVAVNIESHEKSHFNNKTLSKHKLFKEFFFTEENINKIKIINGMWSSLDNELYSYKNNKNVKDLQKEYMRGCNSIFSSFSILPSGEMAACCGLTISKNEYLKLGNVKTSNIKSLFENQYLYFINLWLKIEGPYKILEYLATKEPKIKELPLNHSCQICNCLFNNEILKEAVSKYYIEKIPEVFFKYQIQRHVNNI